MTRLTALVGILLATLLLAAATASAGERHHRHHHGKTPAAKGHGKARTHRAEGHAKGHIKGRPHRVKGHHRRKRGAPRPVPSSVPSVPAAPGPLPGGAPVPATAPSFPPAPAPTPAAVPTPSAPPLGTAAGTVTCPDTGVRPDGTNTAALSAAVLCLVNQQRTGSGLIALTDNAALHRAAQAHSEDMVARSFFSHTTPDGAAFSTRILAAGYPAGARAMAENIAWGSGSLSTPAQIVTNWMSSPGHRANILNGELHGSGIGIAAGAPQAGSGQAGTYTQDFGTP